MLARAETSYRNANLQHRRRHLLSGALTISYVALDTESAKIAKSEKKR